MAWVKIRVPRTSQPQDACEIDCGNPITRGLRVHRTPNSFGWTNVNGATRGVETVGIVDKFNQSLNQGFTSQFEMDAVQCTMMSVFTEPPSSGDRALVGMRNDSGDWQMLYLYSSTYLAYAIAGGGFTQSGGMFDSSPKINVCFGVKTDTKSFVAANGVVLHETPTTQAHTNITTVSVGGGPSGGYGFDGSIYLSAVWDRALTVEEIKSLSDNPWQIFEPEELTIWTPDSAGTGGADNLTPKDITFGAATVSNPSVGQSHVLLGKSLSLLATDVTSPTIYQVHQLSGKSISTDAFTATKPALSYVPTIVTLTGKNISLSSVAIPYPAVGQVHALISKSVSTGSVAVGTSALNQVHTLVGKGVTLSNAIVTSPIISQVHALSGKVIDTGAVNITKPVLVSVFGIDNLIARSITLEALQVTKPSIEQIHVLTGLDVSLDELSITKSALQQVHVLQVQPITLSQVVISKPELASLANTDALSPKDITLSAVTVSNPAITQVHTLVGRALVTGSVSIVKPILRQVNGLTPKGIDLASLSISKPVLTSGVIVGIYPLPEQVLIGVTYGPTGTEYTGTLVVGTGATVYIEQILSEVVDDKIIVLLQDEVIQSNILSETT